MAVTAHGIGGLSIQTSVDEIIPRAPVDSPGFHEGPSSGFLTMCAWCLRIDIGSERVELEIAQRMASESNEFAIQEVTHGICLDGLGNILKSRKRRPSSPKQERRP